VLGFLLMSGDAPRETSEAAAASREAALREWQSRPVVLVGFMGSGKTTVGRILSHHLGRRCVDSDDVVVSRLGASIPELFQRGDEPLFRQVERAVVLELLAERPPLVLALGGGAFMDVETADAALAGGLVVHLVLPLDDLEAELPRLRRGRPLLADRPLEEIRELYRSREAIYKRAHLELTPAREGPAAAADALLQRLHG